METVRTFFEQQYVRMTIDHAAGIIVARWIGFLQLAEVMEGTPERRWLSLHAKK